MKKETQPSAKPKVSLFDPATEQYTALGREVADEAADAIAELFDKYNERGVSMRDLQHIVESEAACAALSRILMAQGE